MSNAIFIEKNMVEFSKDEFDIPGYSEIHRQHENHPKLSRDLEVGDLFCWFLRDNTEYKGDKVVIRFGEGNSQHTWRDFAQTINFLKQFMKKNKKHIFKLADEDSKCNFFDQEIIFGMEYDRILNMMV